MPRLELRAPGLCRVSSRRIASLHRDEQSSTRDSSRLSHSSSSSSARGLRLSSRVRTLMGRLRFIRVVRSSMMIISRLLAIRVNIVVRRLRRILANTVPHNPRFIRVNIAARNPRLIQDNIAAHRLRYQGHTADHHPKYTLHLGYSNSSKNSREGFPRTLWNKTWTGCALAPLPLPPTRVYPVLLLRIGIPLKSEAVLQRRQQQQQQQQQEPQ